MRRSKLLPLRRGEIVVFELPRQPGTLYVKRIVGLPGDTVEFRSGWVFINGQRLDEPYVEEPYRRGVGEFGPVAVGDGHCFLLGDRRNASYDSREWGQVPAELVRGRALHICYSVAEPSAGVLGGIRWRRIGTPLTFDDAASRSE